MTFVSIFFSQSRNFPEPVSEPEPEGRNRNRNRKIFTRFHNTAPDSHTLTHIAKKHWCCEGKVFVWVNLKLKNI